MKRIRGYIFATILIASLLLVLLPGSAFGTGFIISGDTNGLKIHVPEKTQDTGNLNPGDIKHSCLKLVNDGSKSFTVYIKTEILDKSEKSPRGGRLTEIMTLKIEGDGNLVVEDTFKLVASKGNISLGKMIPGSEKIVCLYTEFPDGAANDYQGSSFKAKWVFTTQITGGGSNNGHEHGNENGSSGNGSDKGDTNGSNGNGEPTGKPDNGGQPDPDQTREDDEGEVVEIDDEGIPIGVPTLPRTGENLPYGFYIVGAFFVLAGMGLTLKRK